MSFSFSTNEFGAKCVNWLAMAPPADGSGSNPLMGLLPFVLIFAAMWFLLIAPQRKKQKQHEQMVKELQPGTDVVTIGGLHGTITSVKDDRFVLKIADNVKVEISKASIADKVNQA
ncbi:MAG: preprotein translocase subunit YajC [Opitutae bacterium]|nr:preprotein translocase subunit YajC [Opitutae bacterium]|tara:strand:- start:3948 stop:4295 length:348 start_codon:yes stop_codon:yes gene_type:complete